MASPAIPTPAAPEWAATQYPPAPDPHSGFFGNSPIGHAIANVVTMGAASHPGAAGDYWRSVANSFDPRHPAGAVNLATLLIPGRGGKITPEQQGFLQAIYKTSRGQNAMYQNTPEVGAAAQHLGAPLDQTGQSSAISANVLDWAHGSPAMLMGRPNWLEKPIGYHQGTTDVGMTPGTNIPEVFRGPFFRTFMQRLRGQYAKPNQEDVQNAFSGLLHDPESMRAFLDALIKNRQNDQS